MLSEATDRPGRDTQQPGQHAANLLDGFVPWPEEVAVRYRREGYWQGRTLGGLLRDWAERYGPRTALVHGDSRFTYAELDAAADRRAAGLQDLGVQPGDRVVVQLPNVPEFVVVCFALFRLGAVPVMALPSHRRTEIRHLCELSGAVAYVVADTFDGFDYRDLARELDAGVDTLRHVLVLGDPAEFTSLEKVDAEPRATASPDPAGVAVLLLSGGTTGVPKLIPRTHDDYAYNLRASAEVCGFDESTVYLAALPIAHNFPLACPGILGVMDTGGRVVLAANGNPPEAFPLIEKEGVTATALVPPLALLWMQAAEWVPADLSSLRLLQVGGARLASDAAARVGPTLGCRLQQVFGMAEGLLNYTRLDDPEELVTTTQGRPLAPADEVRVVDAVGEEVPVGELGELWVRGPYTLRGYYQAEEYNRTAFTEDGFYRSGDLVRRGPTGHLSVEGRIRDVINRGGEKVSATEIEDHLVAHPSIRDAAVAALPDEMLGERICAFVIPDGDPPGLVTVKRFLRERGLAEYKLPDRLELEESWPLTSVGKISKQQLAAELARRIAPGEPR